MRKTVFAIALAIGCGDNVTGQILVDADPYDTFQDCWDDHHVDEGFDVRKAIEICCIDHPIGGADANVVCGATAASCETYVTANLTAADLTPADITAACTDYVIQRD